MWKVWRDGTPWSVFEAYLKTMDEQTLVYEGPDGGLVVPWRIDSWCPDHADEVIELLTPEQFERLPDGILLISITGEEQRKGPDWVDFDTRAGRMAWGVPDRRAKE